MILVLVVFGRIFILLSIVSEPIENPTLVGMAITGKTKTNSSKDAGKREPLYTDDGISISSI